MIKHLPVPPIVLLFQGCNPVPSRLETFHCPFTELLTTDVARISTSGIKHNIRALLNLKTNTRLWKVGEIGLPAGDSITIWSPCKRPPHCQSE